MMIFRKLYNWTLDKSSKKEAPWFLCIVSFAESSFFPIPPDLLLLPMALARPLKWIRLALITTVFSVLGGILGYLIGVFLWETIGQYIIEIYHLEEKFINFKDNYNTNGALIVFIAGFTPIPYKLITIASGGMNLNIIIFIIASILSRGARFFLLTGIIRIFGNTAKLFIDKYFSFLTLIVGFILILLILWIYL